MLIKRNGGMFRIGRLTCDDCGYRFLSVTPLLPFLQTLFDIALLRKGPEHIPRSVVTLIMAVLLWLLARLATLALIRGSNEQIFVIEFFSAFFAICMYAMAIILAGKNSRLLQTITAIIGVSAVMRVVYLIGNKLLLPFLGEGFMPIVVIATILWSISVKGHIIASAIGRHWYAGLAVALVVTIVQIAFELSVPIKP
jgi:hypothetical protein